VVDTSPATPDTGTQEGHDVDGRERRGLVPERATGNAFEVSARPTPFQRLAQLWRYRELVGNLTRKELKVKYKNSVLGFAWSLLNPLLYLVIFGFVFQFVLKNNVPAFPIFMLSGLLAFNFFSAALGGSTGVIVMNAGLVTKVWFPREALVVATIGAALVHFFLQSLVLFAAMAVFRRAPSLEYLPALPMALLALALFATALSIALAAINVYMRDTQHLLELVLLAWFWFSAIVYPYKQIVDELTAHGISERVASLNPLLPIVVSFQRVLYNPPDSDQILPAHPLTWYLSHLAVVSVISLVLLYFALVIFGRLEDNFAEEI
jgi:ABC-type polysaccharide/polyol phosphate export permease